MQDKVFTMTCYILPLSSDTEKTLKYLFINKGYQGRIQGSFSYANDEVVFPSYEMKNRVKSV